MARTAKLKVYRTPIGFHDAYVAAPSQKAALDAWGSDANLFTRGIAELVTDEDLTREPLENPGSVIRRLRGSAEEQIAALPVARAQKSGSKASRGDRDAPSDRKRETASARPKSKPKPRPPRAALDRAERELSDMTERQKGEDEAIETRERDLARERRDLDAKHSRDRKAAEGKVAKERAVHTDAMDRWIASQS